MSNDLSTSDSLFRAELPEHLLKTQEPAVALILRAFVKIVFDQNNRSARDSVGRTSVADSAYNIVRPHQVFSIDGGRGSGKTFTLLSINRALDVLNTLVSNRDRRIDEVHRKWGEFVDNHIQDLNITNLGLGGRAPTKVLKIIFPGDMEVRESPMETIFASITTDLNDRVMQLPTASDNQQEVLKHKKLIDDLRENVAQGWYFSKSFGHDAIVRDSIDYSDFIERFERETRGSANRINQWRAFIDRYLDEINVATLTILLDDSDVQPELVHDILHTVRMFLNHPRIITVIAGNIRAMRHSLLQQAMVRLGQSTAAFAQIAVPAAVSNPTVHEWRQIERKAVEDYLEKVLPADQRFYLKSPLQAAYINLPDGPFKRITRSTLREICEGMLQFGRERFLDTKFRLAVRRTLKLHERPSIDERRDLENYLAWWVFLNRYHMTLAPKSARQIRTFGNYYRETAMRAKSGSRSSNGGSKLKRLIFAMFDNPENFTLIQRLGDDDTNVASWLQHQVLDSKWAGQRLFEINGRRIYRGSYTYDYLRFRLDLGLAMPVRDNLEESVPDELLPRIRGRRHIRRFFHPQRMPRRQRPIGVARWIDHAAIPGNCAYFSDLEALPDTSIIPADEEIEPSQDGQWEASLAETGFNMLGDDQDELLYRYFTEVVCTSQRGTADVADGQLLRLLDPPSFEQQEESAIHERFLADEYACLTVGYLDLPLWRWHDPQPGTDSRPLPKVEHPKRMVALFAALINDLRRAWHAVRIYEQAWASAPEQEHIDDQESLATLVSQEKLRLLDRKKIEEVLGMAAGANFLQVFGRENLTQKLHSYNTESPRAASRCANYITEGSIHELYTVRTPPVIADTVTRLPLLAEYRAFQSWIDTLRRLARVTCKDWPVYGKSERWVEREQDYKYYEHYAGFENFLFDMGDQSARPRKDDYQLPVFKESGQDEARLAERQFRARAARNFIWLLYGLAPCLSAVSHSNVMSLVYQAELLLGGLRLMRDKPQQQVSPEEIADVVTQLNRHYADAAAEITAWAELIGKLAVALRYIRTKYLHLHLAFVIQALDDETNPGHDASKRAVLERCGFTNVSTEQARMVFRELKQILITTPGKGHEVSSDLSLMPDMASSTLFWENWIEDAIQRLYNFEQIGMWPEPATRLQTASGDNALDARQNPMLITGVFGETEQWLWATNRCLEKLNNHVQHWRHAAIAELTERGLMTTSDLTL